MGSFGTDGRSLSRRLAATLLCTGFAASPAAAETLDARYAVSLLGLKIGDLYANGSLQPQAYRMDLSARLTGLAAMVSSVRMALESTGSVTKRGTLAHKQEPRAVVEYFVLQRRMWYNSPWVVRDVLYEGLEVRSKTLS